MRRLSDCRSRPHFIYQLQNIWNSAGDRHHYIASSEVSETGYANSNAGRRTSTGYIQTPLYCICANCRTTRRRLIFYIPRGNTTGCPSCKLGGITPSGRAQVRRLKRAYGYGRGLIMDLGKKEQGWQQAFSNLLPFQARRARARSSGHCVSYLDPGWDVRCIKAFGRIAGRVGSEGREQWAGKVNSTDGVVRTFNI